MPAPWTGRASRAPSEDTSGAQGGRSELRRQHTKYKPGQLVPQLKQLTHNLDAAFRGASPPQNRTQPHLTHVPLFSLSVGLSFPV